MAELIDALLSLARLTRTDARRERIDLSEMATKILGQLQEDSPARRVETRISEGLIDLGDPQLVKALLENLLGNAWKFTGKQALARIEVGKLEDSTTYFVRDNGAGFKMEYAAQLYAPFRRLHNVEEFEGTGIGLATVQRIVRRHEGRVWAESAPDQGATFYFTLGPDGERKNT
ncbi:MAG: hypothetical protein J0I12_17975 [Candidatus Eremiobacteraeota bacterium]|nr:hypothetical protein [Candidatus Eremiobacteraeota bacterium]